MHERSKRESLARSILPQNVQPERHAVVANFVLNEGETLKKEVNGTNFTFYVANC